MPTKSKPKVSDGFLIPPDAYQHMLAVMDELAFRGPDQEAIIMRVAKAGGIKEAMKAIVKRRIYAKRRDDATAQREPAEGQPRRGGGGRRRSDRKVKAPKPPAGAPADNAAQAGEGAA